MDNEVEVMRIVRVPPMGKMVVKSGDNRYQHISQVSDDTLRQRIMAAIGELVTFADGYSSLVDAGLAPPLSAEMPTKIMSAEEKLEEDQMAFLDSLESDTGLAPEISSDLPLETGLEPDIATDSGPISITGLINPILQKHVAADPALKGRTIKLTSELDGTLNIVVDGRAYQRPEEIPDAEVRKVLRAALKEWDTS